MAAAGARPPDKERPMIRPSSRRAVAALAIASLALLPPAAHAAPRPVRTFTAFERIAGPLSGLLDRLAALLYPHGVASKRGSSLDPDGATSENGSVIDPFGAESEDDRGSSLDPNGRP
jgi:hypothetical protein